VLSFGVLSTPSQIIKGTDPLSSPSDFTHATQKPYIASVCGAKFRGFIHA